MFVQNHHSLEELQRLTKALTKKRIWLRHQAVVLAKQGHSAPAIARALGCSHRAVQAWVGRYNQGGLAALQERPHTGRPPRLAAADVPRFRDRLEAGPTPEDGVCTFRCQDLRRILEEEFGVSLRRQAIYDLLHRLDYSSLMPRPQHEQANPEVQEFFKEIVVEQIDAIAAAHPEEEIHTYFQDEARFGQKGTITRVWARRGSRPRAVRQTGFSSLYVLAAVCAATGAMSAVIMPTLNTEVVNLFLEQLSRELPAGVHAVLIWDGAGFHTGEDVVVPSTGRTARTGITTRCRRRRSGVCVRSAKTQKRSRPSAILHISQGAHEIAGKRITPGSPSGPARHRPSASHRCPAGRGRRETGRVSRTGRPCRSLTPIGKSEPGSIVRRAPLNSGPFLGLFPS